MERYVKQGAIFIALALFFSVSLKAQILVPIPVPVGGGTPSIIIGTPDCSTGLTDTTITCTWMTTISANSSIQCGASAGKDNGLWPNSTSHVGICAGLLPATGYATTVTSATSTSSPQAITTHAAQTKTAINSAIFSTNIVHGNSGDGGDYPFTFVSSGTQYITQNDGGGFAVTPDTGANMRIGVLTVPSTILGTNLNSLSNYGLENSFNGTDCPSLAGQPMTNKQHGLFGVSGNLYISANRECDSYNQIVFGNFIMSANDGVSWNNYTATGSFNVNGNPPAQGSFQFPNSTIGSVSPLRYAADDGTLGYFTAGNLIDGANAYVYMAYKLTDDGSNEYLMRQLRFLFEEQSTSGIQFWDGTPSVANFTNDANWTSTFASATAIFSASTPGNEGNNYIGEIDFVPTLNTYLFLNSSVPSSSTQAFYGPSPAGPWTFVAAQGNIAACYSPDVLHSNLLANSATTNIALNFLYSCTDEYYFHSQGLTLNPTGNTASFSCGPTIESPISDGGNFATATGYSQTQTVSGNFCEAAASNALAVWTPSFTANQSATTFLGATFSNTLAMGSAAAGPGVRMSTSGTGYILVVSAGASTGQNGNIFAVTGGGGFAALCTFNLDTSPSAGDNYTLSITGSTLTPYQNGVAEATVPSPCVDSTYATGQPGFFVSSMFPGLANQSQIYQFTASTH